MSYSDYFYQKPAKPKQQVALEQQLQEKECIIQALEQNITTVRRHRRHEAAVAEARIQQLERENAQLKAENVRLRRDAERKEAVSNLETNASSSIKLEPGDEQYLSDGEQSEDGDSELETYDQPEIDTVLVSKNLTMTNGARDDHNTRALRPMRQATHASQDVHQNSRPQQSHAGVRAAKAEKSSEIQREDLPTPATNTNVLAGLTILLPTGQSDGTNLHQEVRDALLVQIASARNTDRKKDLWEKGCKNTSCIVSRCQGEKCTVLEQRIGMACDQCKEKKRFCIQKTKNGIPRVVPLAQDLREGYVPADLRYWRR